MKRAVAAMAIIFVVASACSSAGQTDDVVTGEQALPAATSTAPVPTTAIAVVPAGTPTAVNVPTVAPAPTVVAAAPTAVVEPTATTVAAQATTQPAGPTPLPVPPTPNQSNEVLASNGGEVYTLTCARCHAENGTGSDKYPRGIVGVGSQYTTNAMIAELTSGHPVTFGFADKLSADEIASVVAYVKATFP